MVIQLIRHINKDTFCVFVYLWYISYVHQMYFNLWVHIVQCTTHRFVYTHMIRFLSLISLLNKQKQGYWINLVGLSHKLLDLSLSRYTWPSNDIIEPFQWENKIHIIYISSCALQCKQRAKTRVIKNSSPAFAYHFSGIKNKLKFGLFQIEHSFCVLYKGVPFDWLTFSNDDVLLC